MSDRTDRRDYREDLGTLMSPLVAGTGKPAQAFYDHLESDFDGASPTICLASEGSTPVPFSIKGWRYQHRLRVLVFVTRDDPNADDTLDDCYEAIADVIEGNRRTANWTDLQFNGPSQIDAASWGGDPYWIEAIPIIVAGF